MILMHMDVVVKVYEKLNFFHSICLTVEVTNLENYLCNTFLNKKTEINHRKFGD